MKTKNIFRMLLVAAALLLGANNVKADAFSISYNISGNGSVSANQETANEGDQITLTVSPSLGHRLKELIVRDGSYVPIEMTDETHFVMPAKNVIVYATFEAIQYAITINSTEHGSLNVYRDTAPYGETITIQAQAQYGYELESVSVVDANNNNIEVSPNLTFTMPASSITISGTFVPQRYKLTWQIIGDTNPYLEQMIPNGDPIVEPETPTREGYLFNGWNQHEQTMPARNYTITGSFSQIYTITLNYDSSKGSATLNKETSLGNEEIQLTVTPNSGFEVASVTGSDANGNLNIWDSYKFRVNASNVTINITFRATGTTSYSIYNNGATNGSVSADKSTAAAGETVTLSSTPNTGYELDYYIVTGENNTTITVNGNQFTMPAGNVWISAVFKQIEYAITINASENGTVSANKATGLHYNDNVTLTITPNSGFELDQLFVKDANNNPINVNNYQFQMPASNVTVSATFKSASEQETPTTYSITIHSMQNGSVVASKTSDITAGEEITLTVTPNSGYQLTSLNVKDANDATITVSDNNTFTMPASNVTISAIFSLISVRTEYASIGNWGYATFSSGSALNFANVTGIKAYVATSVDNQQVTLTQVMGTVAEGTGLVIIRDDNNSDLVFEIPVVQSGSEYNNNLLVPGYGNPLTLSNSYTDYVLTVKDGEVKFAEVWSEKHLPTIDVGKAYLHIPATNGAHTRSLSVVIDNGTTGINGVENEQRENVIYNLRGQRVENPTKGLYIINGKKVIIK